MKSIISTYRIKILMIAAFFVINSIADAQTNPTPYNLSTGPYEFSTWDSLSPKGTFPESMVFHYVAANQVAPFYTNASSDYDCSYHKSKRPRINGLMQHGVGIVTTSSAQYNDCDSGAADNRFMGAVVLALNATERSNLRMRWKSETVTPGDGNGVPSNPRVWKLRLQYRIGINGLFSDIPGPVEFTSSTSSGDSIQFGPISLPAACNNQPVVQLRWIYFESSAGAGGSRPKLRLDDIEVSSDNALGMGEQLSETNAFFSLFPNPARDQFTIRANDPSFARYQVTDHLGRLIAEGLLNESETILNCSTFPAGTYFVRIWDDLRHRFENHKLLIR